MIILEHSPQSSLVHLGRLGSVVRLAHPEQARIVHLGRLGRAVI